MTYLSERKRNPMTVAALASAAVFVLLAQFARPLEAQEAGAASTAAHQQFVFAYRLLQRGEDKLSIEAFDEYLSRFPGDEKRGDGLYYRALLARRANSNVQAIKFLEGAPTTKHVPDHAVLLLTGQVYTDLGQFDRAIAALEKISVDKLKPDVQASVFYLRAQSYRGLKNLPAAVGQLNEVIKIDSELKGKALLDLGRVLSLLEKNDEAIAALEQCIATNDPAVGAEAARLAGDLSFQAAKFDKAMEFYRIVATRFTSSDHLSPAVVGMLWAQFQLKQYGQALETFERHNKVLTSEDRVTAWYLAGASQQELGRHDQAIAMFGAILAAAAGSPLEDKVLFRFASSQFEAGQYEGMTQTIAKLRRSYPESPRLADAGFLMASAALKQGDMTTAAARLTAIVDAGDSHPYFTQALLQRARLYESIKQLPPAADDYQRYVQVYSEAKDQIKLGEQTVRQAALRLVDVNYQLGRNDQAVTAARQLLDRKDLTPQDESEGMYRLALSQVKLRQLEPAHQTITGLLAKHPQNRYRADALYYRGLLGFSLKKQDEAVKDLQEAAGSDQLASPLKINAYRLVAMRQRELDQKPAAAATLAVLEKMVGISGLNTQEQIWIARYQVEQKDPRKALIYLKPVLEGNASAPRPVRAEALMVAAAALRDLKDNAGAITALREVVAMGGQTHGLTARLELARTLALDGQNEEAIGEFNGLFSVEETLVAASALFDAGTLHRKIVQQRLLGSDAAGADQQREEARKAFKRLVLLYSFPEVSPLPELSLINLAEIAEENQNIETARAEIKELQDKYPDGPYGAYAKAVAARLDNQVQVARTLLTRLAEQKLDERLAERVAGQIKSLEGKS